MNLTDILKVFFVAFWCAGWLATFFEVLGRAIITQRYNPGRADCRVRFWEALFLFVILFVCWLPWLILERRRGSI